MVRPFIISHHDVQGTLQEGVSSGRDAHTPQVSPDRHQATVRNQKKHVTIATWNVRTMQQAGKTENIIKEMDRMAINILGISEMRWKNSGERREGDHLIIYSGGERHARGVGFVLDKEHARAVKGFMAFSDRVILLKISSKPLDYNIIQVYAPTTESTKEDLEKFYDELNGALKTCKSQEVTMVMGDFNAKVGMGRQDNIVGPHGLGARNERGEVLVEWAAQNRFTIANTWCEVPERRKWTWRSPGGYAKNQIDFILIKERFRNAVKSCKSYPGVDCGSDHAPVIAKLHMKLRKLKKARTKPKLDLQKLKENPGIKEQYKIEVSNRFATLENITDVEEEYRHITTSLVSAAEKIIPKQKKKARQRWMTEEILELMEDRRKLPRGSDEYREKDREIKRRCDEAKEDWLKKECEKVERLYRTDIKNMFQKVKDLSGKNKTTHSAGYLLSKDGTPIMEKEKIRTRWCEYIAELYGSERDEEFEPHYNNEGPQIMKEEVKNALKKMKKGKATGEDGVSTELIEALEEMGINKITNIMNKIYDSGTIPQGMLTSTFIALPKKPKAAECGQHRTISLMSHITKILLRIIMLRIRNKIRPEIGEEQCGFVEGKGTMNAIYILKTLGERAMEMQQDLFLCFIDYTKAFDTIQHQHLIQLLEELNVDGKDLRIIKNLYWAQAANIRVDGEVGEYVKIRRGVRQGCVMSPDLFSLYTEFVMRKIDNMPGIKVGGKNINNLRYADDTVLIATKEDDLQHILNIVNNESEEVGLKINNKKTFTMTISKQKEPPTCNITLCNQQLQQVDSFKYLGATITSDGRSIGEIKIRIAQAKTAFMDLRKILTSQRITTETRRRVLENYIYPILQYGSEAWNINRKAADIINAAEMWCYRKALKISFEDHITNEEVLTRMGTERNLLKSTRKRQAQFFGHAMRREKLEHLVTTGKIEGRKSRGRPREKILDGISGWLSSEPLDVLRRVREREEWKAMVTYASRLGT